MKSGLWILVIVVIVAIVVGFLLRKKNENLRAWAEIEIMEDAEARVGMLETFMTEYPEDEHREDGFKMYADLLLKEVGDSARFIAYAERLLETEIDPDIKDCVYPALDRARNTRGMLTEMGEIEDPESRIAAVEEFLAEFPDTRNKDRAYYLMGNTMVDALKDTVRLERLAERVIGEEPDADARALMYYMLYSVHVDTNPEKSLAVMERLVDNPVDAGWIYSYIASDISSRDLDADLALRLCGRGLEYAKDAGDSADAFDSRGWIYYGREKYDMAIRDLEAAVAAAKEPDERYLEHLGRAALAAGDGDRAFEALESLLVLGEYDFAKSTLDSLMDRRGYSDEEKEKFGESIWERRIAGAMTAEAFTLSDISDAPFAYVPTGKVTLLNFMSPTCGPCFAELPHLQAFHEKYDPSQVAVILIDVRNLKEQTGKMAEEESLTMPVLLDSESVSRDLYGVYATPTTFIVDQAGRAIFKHTGYGEGQEVMLETEIELLLERGTT